MASVRPGDVLAGKYRVERVLGTGGMGFVVAARHLQLDQLVAMKFLRRGSLDDTEATGRFLREAKASVRLRNEHVARVYDVGTLDSGEPYIVMEYLDGCDLSALAKQRGAISPNEAVEYVLQASEALAEAHSLRIIHRDIKLANLFVTRGPSGTPLVKVLDFGISKTNPFGETEHEMTRTASMLGSPRFMSPEQMRDPRLVDARSDIWSLGVVLYRLVAGKPPFEAETLGRLLTMVMHESPEPLSSIRQDLPAGFDHVVARCLAKDPAQRFANVAELAYALSVFAVEPARARAMADRIAATLSVSMLPANQEITLTAPPSTARPSGPPGVSDTGTASPWSGTHGGGKASPHKNPIMWAAVGAFALLACGLAFAKVHYDRTHAELPRAAPLPVETALPTPVPAPPPAADPTPAVGAAAPVVGTPKPIALGVVPPNPPIDDKREATPAPPAKRPSTPVYVAPRKPAPAAKPAAGDGIPSTRD